MKNICICEKDISMQYLLILTASNHKTETLEIPSKRDVTQFSYYKLHFFLSNMAHNRATVK